MKKKIVKTKKKVVKKVAKKAPKRTSQEVVIRVVQDQLPIVIKDTDIVDPIKEKSKFMIPKTWISEKQVIQMVQRTPAQHIYKRPGKGGQVWDYVTGTYITKVLNFTFGWNWDFEVISHGKEGDQIWVHGKLIVKDDSGHTISKSQFGRADIKINKSTNKPLDYGNDLKAASTDALKKCASLLGIASDIYGKMEYKIEASKRVVDTPEENPTAPDMVAQDKIKGPNGDLVVVCVNCDEIVDEKVAGFSKKIYKKILCRDCQPKNN